MKDLFVHPSIHYLSLTSPLYVPCMTHASRALKSHDLSGEGIRSGSHTFMTTQGRGGPPRMSDQLNVGATSETT